MKLDLGRRLPPVKGNAGKLQQVFLNLFLNARDAMEAAACWPCAPGPRTPALRVEVADTGHGIAPEHLHRIYDPFFTTKGARKGTGLGLSVTYGIVQEHRRCHRSLQPPGAAPVSSFDCLGPDRAARESRRMSASKRPVNAA